MSNTPLIVDLPSVNTNWQQTITKNNPLAIIQIILYSITFYRHHQMWAVLYRIIFSHTPDEAMSGGLAKACVPGKNCSVPEKIEFLNEYQTE